MNMTTTIPTTIQIRRGRFLGLVVAVALLAAAVTLVLDITVGGRSQPSHAATPTREEVLSPLSPTARQYVEAISAMSPRERAAIYGTNPVEALAFPTDARQYANAVAAMTPQELAATYGNVRVIGQRDISSTAAVVAGLGPTERAYVEGIMALTPEQLAAGFGTG
jgi:hypothetical protein